MKAAVPLHRAGVILLLRAQLLLLALVCGSSPRLVQGMMLRQNRSQSLRQAPVAPPVGDSERKPKACSCDFCISKPRPEATQVSDMMCKTPFGMDPDVECYEEDDVISDAPQGVPYILFCQCGCQPLSHTEDQQCVALSAAEREQAKTADGGCQDPALQTSKEVWQYEDEQAAAAAAAAAKKAAQEFKEAKTTPKQKEQLKTLKDTLKKTKASVEKLETALENSKKALEHR